MIFFGNETRTSSCTNAVMTSKSEIVDVSDANTSNKKKNADHISDAGSDCNSCGIVINTSPGPPAFSVSVIVSGCAASANAAGKMTTPASNATDVSSAAIVPAVFASRTSRPKYDA